MGNADEDDLAREWDVYSSRIDPIARELAIESDPGVAYDLVGQASAALFDDLDWLPHGGAVFVAWKELEDLFETGMTPTPDAHAALRSAASAWCARPTRPSASFIEGWIEAVAQAVRNLTERDGDFWRQPHPMARFLVDLETDLDPNEHRDYEPVELIRYALTTSDYWADLAVHWLEAGVPAHQLVSELEVLESRRQWPQSLRHRAKRLRKLSS